MNRISRGTNQHSIWPSKQDCIARQVQGHTTQLDREFQAFTRLQQFVRRYQGPKGDDIDAARDTLLVLADEFKLSWRAAARLFVTLRKLADSHRLNRELEDIGRSADFLEVLRQLQRPTSKLAEFARQYIEKPSDKSTQIAGLRLENSAWAWANRAFKNRLVDAKLWDQAERLGFCGPHTLVDNRVEYDSQAVLRKWLELHLLFDELLQAELKAEYGRRDAKAAISSGKDEKSSAIDQKMAEELRTFTRSQTRLIGAKLPKLYHRTTGRNFYVPRASGRAENKYGVRFVNLALQVMGFPPVKPDTIREYFDFCRDEELNKGQGE